MFKCIPKQHDKTTTYLFLKNKRYNIFSIFSVHGKFHLRKIKKEKEKRKLIEKTAESTSQFNFFS